MLRLQQLALKSHRNIEFNRATIEAAGGSVKSAELWWGEEGFKTSPFAQENGQPFDILVGSDLIYDHDVHEFLLWSMDKVCTGLFARGGF